MSDQRPDDETLGRALGRAVETQSVRETPFERSRLAHKIDRPARGGWLGTLAAAAAIALFIGMGAFFFSRGPHGATTPDATETPAIAATSGPGATRSASPSATAAPSVIPGRVYFARDGLPPVGVDRSLELEPGMSADRLPVEQHIGRLLAALGGKTAQVPAGAIDAFPRSDPAGYHGQRVAVAGDLATIDFEIRRPNGDWGVRGATQSQALLQQIVYTATEVPGIRRVRLLQNGSPLTIDQLVIDKPLSREDVLSYGFLGTKESRVSVGDSDPQPRSVSDWRASVDDVGPGLTRFVVEFVPSALPPSGLVIPRFTAGLEPNTDTQRAHKWELRVTMPDAIWPDVARTGAPFQCCALKPVDRTPLRWISAGPESAGNARGVIFTLALDDARPWRTTVLQSPLRLVVDIGGAQQSVSESVAVYDPASGATVSRKFTVSGLARAFEANASWRVRASGSIVASGFTTASIGTSPIWGTFQTDVTLPPSVSGAVTLEVFWMSPRDGSDTGLVSIPLQVR